VALEACGGAHHWARQLTQLGHEVRLIPPAYVKPFVKRQKNDAIDAEAICEAAQRPSMRFVAVKSEQQQAAGLVFRTRDLLVRQRTLLIVPAARVYDLVPVRELPYMPEVHRCIRGRTDGSILLRANLLQKPLALSGASTDEYTPFRRPSVQLFLVASM
jgi:Transposase